MSLYWSVNSMPRRADVGALVRLAVPVAGVQVGMMLMGVVDTVMVGRYSSTALASVGLANQYVWGVSVFMFGVLMALEPVVTQAVGAGDEEAVARGVQRGLVLAGVLAAVTAVLMLPAEGVLWVLEQPEEIVPEAAEYLWISIPGMPPLYAFVVARLVLQARQRLAPIVWAMVISNVANAVLDYAMIYGVEGLGIPEMGVAGSAWATTMCRWVMLGGLVALARRELMPELWPVRDGVGHRAPLRRMVRLGVPIGAHLWLEFMAFTVIALLMGAIGTTALAAHHVALNLASLTFMVPLGVAQAATVLVGNAIGSGEEDRARRAALAGLIVGAGFMCFTAAVFVGVPGALAKVYTDDAGVAVLAASLLPIAGVFQVFDGLQAVGAGVLRGAGDTLWPMVIGLLGFWVVGVTASVVLAFVLERGAVGLWWGFVVGLLAVSSMLLWRVYRRLGRSLHRVVIDAHPPSRGEAGGAA